MLYRRYLPLILSTCLLSLAAIPFSAAAATSAKCPGEEGYIYTNDRNSRNPRAGGFVSHSAFVDDGVFIAPTAAVCGSASVLRYARVYGNAIVGGEAEVTDKARVYGNALVDGTAYVGGEAKVSDHAHVSGEAIVEGMAWIRGYAKISAGHYSEGTKKPAKSQQTINAENRKAAEARARAAKAEQDRKAQAEREAKEKRAQCERDWYSKKERLQGYVEDAQRACNRRDCYNNGYSNPGAKKLRSQWSAANRNLKDHEDTRPWAVCR